MDFLNVYDQGFVRVAARVLPIHLAQPHKNAEALINDIRAMDAEGVALVAYPELCITGYSCEDLFLQQTLLDSAEEAIGTLVEASENLRPYIVVGAPIRYQSRLYNCAVVIQGGELVGIVPKSYLPNYREFYERRWFAPGDDIWGVIEVAGRSTMIDPNAIWGIEASEGFAFHVEVCEDMWVPVTPSAQAALHGATVLVNISGSPITIGKADDRKLLAQSTSARCNAAYVFTAAGPGESSTDLSWDGQTFIYEAGELLGESERFPSTASGTIVDLDCRRLVQERYRQGSFDDNRRTNSDEGFSIDHREIELPAGEIGFRRELDRFPYVPDDPARLAQDCYEAYNIQVYGLVQRMKAIGSPKLIIGVSGGLDSTHALIVCAKAMDLLGRPRSDILAFTMPGFATSDQTKSSALALMEAMGTTYETIDIRPAATQMLADMGHGFAHGEELYDVTFENVQAGLRTDYLFRLANQRGGIVVGTGDLSELALGWCTYGVGDHMCHYAVNTGVPKTLIQYLIRWVMDEGLFNQATNEILNTILNQEISPELVPAKEDEGLQSTESIIGPYALNDFFLYHFLRRGETPTRIAYLAWNAWRDSTTGTWPTSWPETRKVDYSLESIRGWLELFLKRFFANQFKRSALPNGPKVSAGGTLSPRGDWRMPSDVSEATWLRELNKNLPSEAM
ncbi:MAG: NAD(+) synthase [Propionibacteriaceae bacterium]|jgi:NAD+ synthase (glutamine-hydrolysing)|nr:NAD(+) synthase [Propionibacteriaceae bacterium]